MITETELYTFLRIISNEKHACFFFIIKTEIYTVVPFTPFLFDRFCVFLLILYFQRHLKNSHILFLKHLFVSLALSSMAYRGVNRVYMFAEVILRFRRPIVLSLDVSVNSLV